MRGSELVDISGQKFGFLTAIEPEPKGPKRRRWVCICDCGKSMLAHGSSLRNGSKKTCGHCPSLMLPPGEAAFRQLMNQYRQNARNRGHEFSLTAEEFKSITSSDCEYCGKAPTSIYKKARASIKDSSSYAYNGVDRVNNSLGYVQGNCVPCCKECNAWKSDMKYLDFVLQAQRISDHSRGIAWK